MLQLGLPTIGTMTLDVSNFLMAHPALIHEVGGHALAHVLYSYVRRAGRGGRHNRRMTRKALNRRRRWFIDNIIMHHRRLHERNREIVVGSARARVMARREALKKEQQRAQAAPQQQREKEKGENKWRNAVSLKERGAALRGRTDTRKLRARSRWISAAGDTTTS